MRKTGKKIKTLCCLPNGIRRDTLWELPLRAAMLAIRNGEITQAQYDDLHTLADMAKRTAKTTHITRHADSLTHVLKPIGVRGGKATANEAASVVASCKVLLDHVAGVSNGEIGRAAVSAIKGNG